jgi:hypothetical protein
MNGTSQIASDLSSGETVDFSGKGLKLDAEADGCIYRMSLLHWVIN